MYKFLPILVFLFFRFAVSLLLESVPKESPKCFVTLPSFSSSWFSSTLPPLAPAEATALPTLAPRALAAALPAPRASLRLAVPSLPGLSLAVNVCFSSLLFSSLNHFSINHFFQALLPKSLVETPMLPTTTPMVLLMLGCMFKSFSSFIKTTTFFTFSHFFSFFLIFSHFPCSFLGGRSTPATGLPAAVVLLLAASLPTVHVPRRSLVGVATPGSIGPLAASAGTLLVSAAVQLLKSFHLVFFSLSLSLSSFFFFLFSFLFFFST